MLATSTAPPQKRICRPACRLDSDDNGVCEDAMLCCHVRRVAGLCGMGGKKRPHSLAQALAPKYLDAPPPGTPKFPTCHTQFKYGFYHYNGKQKEKHEYYTICDGNRSAFKHVLFR